MTMEFTLKAMATNYTPGQHTWDHLDTEACLKASLEIRRLKNKLIEIEAFVKEAREGVNG